jgi:hypothetical protein
MQLPEQQSPLPTQRSPTAAHAHVAVAPAALLSVNTIAGDVPPLGQQGTTRVRLFDSLVKLCLSHVGPLVVPLPTSVRTTIVAPELKTASSPPPSPKTLNSASCHWLPRSGK